MELVRLSKVMALRGICSRREADAYIEKGQVQVDGEIISVLGTKIPHDAHVELLSEAQEAQESKVTILLNKPLGLVSTQAEKGYRPAVDLITPENQQWGQSDLKWQRSHMNKLAVAGRLDIDSKGLLIFTQDGVLVKQLIGPDCGTEKEYLVRVEGHVSQEAIQQLRIGLHLDGKALKPAQIDILQPNLLRMTLIEGKKRQIRRMCELVDLNVVKLKRVRVGSILLGDLPEGKWRYLEPTETFVAARTRAKSRGTKPAIIPGRTS